MNVKDMLRQASDAVKQFDKRYRIKRLSGS